MSTPYKRFASFVSIIIIANIAYGFDSLNVSFVGNWPFGPSYAVAYDSARVLIFLGSGGGVYILDVSDPTSPIKLSEKIHTRGFVHSLFYDASTCQLYIGAEVGGFEIWNVSDPINPIKLSCVCISGLVLDVTVLNEYAYIVNGLGLRIIDISNPMSPVEIGGWSAPMGGANGVAISDSYAYVIDCYDGLHIINVNSQQEVGYWSSIAGLLDVALSDSYAYVSSDANLHIIDISNPLVPIKVAESYIQYTANNVFVLDTFVYVVDQIVWGGGGLHIINISNPLSPIEVSFFETQGRSYDVVVSDSFAYIANFQQGLKVINLSNLTSLQEIGDYSVPSRTLDVAIVDSYAYISTWKDGFRVIDISDPSLPVEIGHYNRSNVKSIVVLPPYAYTIASGGWYRFRILDVSDPTSPTQICSCYRYSADEIAVVGSYAYIVEGDSGLHIYNISNPSVPAKVSTYSELIDPKDIVIVDSCAYVADKEKGMVIINISDPTNPQEIGQCITPVDAYSIAVSDSYAYVGDIYSRGVRLINVNDLTNPYELSFCLTSGAPWKIAVAGSYVYVANGNRDPFIGGVHIIDVSNPLVPEKVGFYTTPAPYNPASVAVSNPYVYIANSHCGLQIYENLLIGVEEDIRFDIQDLILEIFPNPSVGVTSLKFISPVVGDMEMSIYDCSGRLIKTKKQKLKAKIQEIIRLYDLKSGIYFYHVNIRTKNKCIEKNGKFIIL